MGRERRVIDPEYPYHVVTKGNNGGRIVYDSVDCELFCHDLDRVADKYEWEAWAWCLMPNHFHLVVRTPTGGLSEGMQHLNGNNGRRMNSRHGREGHIVRNRFFAVALESETHAVAAVAYVARNPLKAGLCRTAGAWPWSSYRATIGVEPAPPWLAVSRALGLFGHDRNDAVRGFRDIVHSGQLPSADTIDKVSRLEPPGRDARNVA
jgi:REP element-mobilizing transposase RayT